MTSKGAGKGSSPRLGQYSPRAVSAFSKGHECAFGKGCSMCKDNSGRSRGYIWAEDQNGSMVRQSCAVCNGTGRDNDK